MADDESKLSSKELNETQRAELIKLLTERLGEFKCEACGHDIWTINRRVVSPLMLALTDEGPNYIQADVETAHPSALLHCAKCGNLKFFSMAALGFDPTAERMK
jgi:hypothetical protein